MSPRRSRASAKTSARDNYKYEPENDVRSARSRNPEIAPTLDPVYVPTLFICRETTAAAPLMFRLSSLLDVFTAIVACFRFRRLALATNITFSIPNKLNIQQ